MRRQDVVGYPFVAKSAQSTVRFTSWEVGTVIKSISVLEGYEVGAERTDWCMDAFDIVGYTALTELEKLASELKEVVKAEAIALQAMQTEVGAKRNDLKAINRTIKYLKEVM